MTTKVTDDNPDNASLARGGEGDSGKQTNYLTQADLDRAIREVNAASDRRANALQSRLNQTEQQLYDANQRYAEMQTASQYDDEEDRRAAIASMREQQNNQQATARGQWVERTLTAQTRAIKALATASIPWGNKSIDWADDAQSPEEVADRIIASIPHAREVMQAETESYRRQNVTRQTTPPANTAPPDDSVVDTGEPSGSTPAGIVKNYWNYSREERESIRKLARRRNVDGSSALSIDQL